MELTWVCELPGWVTFENIEAFTPDHDRASCDDGNRQLTVAVDNKSPRCRRCILLEALECGEWPQEVFIRLELGLS